MDKPNVIFILADDMGYGDISCLNEAAKLQTPNIDSLASNGLTFTDAHTSSSVCTPSRYSIMTGRYCWRTYLKKGVLSGTGNALLERGRKTVANVFKDSGYKTACIGKWHLGWDWAIKKGHEANLNGWSPDDYDWIDYNKPVQNGPISNGFDHFFGICGSLDMPPYVYVKDDMPVEEPKSWATQQDFFRAGPRMSSMRSNNVLEHITDRAVDYIHKHDQENPFFLYFPITAPHTPISPAPDFDGISGINPYIDFCIEVDHRVGQVLKALKDTDQFENTWVIFTSDNGASAIPSEVQDLEERFGHYCSYIYRGYKSDIWDGGHRIPYVMQWPNGIEAGQTCDSAIGIFDFMATVCHLLQIAPDDSLAEDSVSYLSAFQGDALDPNKRTALIHHSIEGMFAIRKGKFKLCRCAGSGGWSEPTEQTAVKAALLEVQLFDLENDPEERVNIAMQHRDIVDDLTKELHIAVIRGRTTEGLSQPNDKRVPLEKWDQLNWLPKIPKLYIEDD
ncbi:MAG: arylsulfatase [Lentisphaeria bacterium]|nr:arylsulfatase [Lentisphaeria bacterium]